jgi:spore coat polysaccharide biosynthesis protein SpsF (cytidylyltransferase family)
MPRRIAGVVTKVCGVIQARMGSTRLPGKILAPLVGLPLLSVLWERVRTARSIDQWWLATSVLPTDDITAAWGATLG